MQKHSWISSSIGRKQLIGLTGLSLSIFVLMHMLGNLLIFVGPQAYNEYGHAMVSNPLLIPAETGLLVMFVGHVLFALWISFLNFRARPTRYAMAASGDKSTSAIQKTLWMQGLLILVFVILHLITFKYGAHYTVNYGKGEIRDLHKLMVEVFASPIYVSWYVVAVIVLGFHLSHGIGSMFQTFGFNHPKYNRALKTLSWTYGVIVGAGFVAQPLYVFLFQ